MLMLCHRSWIFYGLEKGAKWNERKSELIPRVHYDMIRCTVTITNWIAWFRPFGKNVYWQTQIQCVLHKQQQYKHWTVRGAMRMYSWWLLYQIKLHVSFYLFICYEGLLNWCQCQFFLLYEIQMALRHILASASYSNHSEKANFTSRFV